MIPLKRNCTFLNKLDNTLNNLFAIRPPIYVIP